VNPCETKDRISALGAYTVFGETSYFA